jgi:hypothetical protein
MTLRFHYAKVNYYIQPTRYESLATGSRALAHA